MPQALDHLHVCLRVKSSNRCPADGWNSVRSVWKSTRTSPCCCRILPPSLQREPPATCRKDTYPRPATSAPDGGDEPEDTAALHRFTANHTHPVLETLVGLLTLMSVPSLQCQTMPSTRPSGLSWNQDRSCWKSTGGGFLIPTLPWDTRKWTGCFLLPIPVRTATW